MFNVKNRLNLLLHFPHFKSCFRFKNPRTRYGSKFTETVERRNKERMETMIRWRKGRREEGRKEKRWGDKEMWGHKGENVKKVFKVKSLFLLTVFLVLNVKCEFLRDSSVFLQMWWKNLCLKKPQNQTVTFYLCKLHENFSHFEVKWGTTECSVIFLQHFPCMHCSQEELWGFLCIRL